jgi:translation initiation factor 2B subunit (eIF-2B alpha/beta/delta family)
MLAVAAHQLNIPVLGITRSYCLWEHIMVNQSSLILSESGKSQFPHEDESSFRVLISKKYDYLEPKLVNSLVS